MPAITIALIGIFFVFPILLIVQAAVLNSLYIWFLEPVVGIPLGIIHWIGILLMFSMFHRMRTENNAETDIAEVFLMRMSHHAMMYGIGGLIAKIGGLI